MKVYLGLGANLGEPEDNIRNALEMIADRGMGQVCAVSSFYRTEPMGVKDQPWFINAAALVETNMEPLDFFAGLREIEAALGKTANNERNGPRLIDLDILLWEDKSISLDDLQVPHPRMHERRFVLEPLAEIAPDAVHPGESKTAGELLKELEDRSSVVKL